MKSMLRIECGSNIVFGNAIISFSFIIYKEGCSAADSLAASASLRQYAPGEASYLSSDVLDPVEFTMSMIPNSKDKPQGDALWLMVGDQPRLMLKVPITYHKVVGEGITLFAESQVALLPGLHLTFSQKPQGHAVWWLIGMALRNQSLDEGDRDKYLSVWIRWSKLAPGVYPNEEKVCRREWNTMEIRKDDRVRAKIPTLLKVAEVYRLDVVVGAMVRARVNFERLFKLDVDHFDEIDTYSDTPNGYCKPYDLERFDIEISQSPMGSGKTYQIQQVATSPTNSNSLENSNILLDLVRHSRKTIVVDAFLSNRTKNLFSMLRSRFGKRVGVSVNKATWDKDEKCAVVRGIAKSLREISDVKHRFVKHLSAAVKRGEKLCVVVGSKAFKDEVLEIVVAMMGPDFAKQIAEYDRLTDEATMAGLVNVNERWWVPMCVS
ncbi:hypothetical protein M427DRAFT_507618 [Gonapodya prolifera JEL478]|uniref:Primase C-terminal 2 domain-containing protein n=1 Tax=Gonapodya prolifera (strain JEL478) TaxID=1344416 RepID=A0A139A1K2_GONPJ|nr:hypothetical protein M427DRAFT_507618 [Gonapodya prolifera JEL478]|eukprot:KXS10670.1 hypothetical protein M427DRAFT_507618 [Gonapodya prolifera JEL478]